MPPRILEKTHKYYARTADNNIEIETDDDEEYSRRIGEMDDFKLYIILSIKV